MITPIPRNPLMLWIYQYLSDWCCTGLLVKALSHVVFIFVFQVLRLKGGAGEDDIDQLQQMQIELEEKIAKLNDGIEAWEEQVAEAQTKHFDLINDFDASPEERNNAQFVVTQLEMALTKMKDTLTKVSTFVQL